MKKALIMLLFLALINVLPAMEEEFAKGQLFISAYAGFIPAEGKGWDVMYNLCFESAISRNISIVFAYSQKQSHSGENQDHLVVPIAAGTAATEGALDFIDITTRLFCLEGKYHFAAAKRLDLFCGSGFGLELNKSNSLHFFVSPDDGTLVISNIDKNHYYMVANFFAGVSYYLADNLAFSTKAGYQYSGISGADVVLSTGITFRIK